MKYSKEKDNGRRTVGGDLEGPLMGDNAPNAHKGTKGGNLRQGITGSEPLKDNHTGPL